MKEYFRHLTNLPTLLAFCMLFNLPLGVAMPGAGSGSEPVELRFSLEDPEGQPVRNAVVILPNGRFYPDDNGYVEIMAAEDATMIIEAKGYTNIVFDIEDAPLPETITLYDEPPQSGEEDIINLPMQMTSSRRHITGAVSSISGDKLVTSPEPLLSNTLQGHGLGLVSIMNAGGMSNNPASLYIRGLGREEDNQVITVVDGIERPIDHLMAEEIESIELLKDATTKILYGPRAANGVLMITTRRGDENRRTMNVNVDYGYGLPSGYPEFVDAYTYANLYNEARANDGLTPMYNEADLDGYRNSSGKNDIRYPDADYYDHFLRNHTNYSKFTGEFGGGGDNARYFLILGYTGARGLENAGTQPRNDRFNIRGNLDLNVSDMISAHMDIAGRFETMERGSIDHSQFFGALSSHRPNEYPFVIDAEYLPPDTLGNPALGASMHRSSNLYGDLKYSGYYNNQYFSGQTNFGLDFDFDPWLEGLSANTYVTFDNYFFGAENLSNQPSMYIRRWLTDQQGSDSLAFQMVQRENYDPQLRLTSNENLRNTGLSAGLNYQRSFGDHYVNADMGFLYALNEQAGQWVTQHIEYVNTVFRSVYAYKDRYIGELTLAYMGSNKFVRENRFNAFPAAGAAWIVSEESFFDIEAINYLKLKASGGILGYDGATPHWLYLDRWQNLGSVSFGDPSGTNQEQVMYSMRGNPDLEWEKSREINAGLEAMAFDHRLWLEVNYFNNHRYDIIHFLDSEIPDVYGSRFMHFNWGEVKNRGLEIGLQWADRGNTLNYSLGANYIYSENEIVRTNEVLYPDDYRRMTGLPSDAMMGYVSAGLFGRDVGLDGHPHQTFGPYGIGDIAYADLNNDGVVDDNDRKMLGNNFPRHVIGLDFQLEYNGWGLYVLTTANLGVNSWLNNSYYWNRLDDKYSVITLDRYHPDNNPAGDYPRLTTTSGENNFRNSDFWLENTSFLRLKNVELSYTFNNVAIDAVPRSLKVYMRGTNLFVLSRLNELDPEALSAGLNNYPVLTFVSAGVSVSF